MFFEPMRCPPNRRTNVKSVILKVYNRIDDGSVQIKVKKID